MPIIKANSINIYYEIYGQGDPLILVAGLSADHNVWKSVIDRLRKHYQVIVFDNRGIGLSDCPDYPYSIEMLADDTAELAKALNISKAHFIGVSMGGAIVQQIAYKYPKLTRSIVIENSSYRFDDIRLRIYGQARANLMRANAYSADAYRMALPLIFSDEFLNKSGVVESLVEMFINNPHPMTLQGYLNQLACFNFNSYDWLEKIVAPTLVITADEDLLINPKHSRKMANLIPNAKYYCFKSVGHLPHIEQPASFTNLVLDYFSKQ